MKNRGVSQTVHGEEPDDYRKVYDAVDIARRMVQISIRDRIPLTNLKLQKLLYYAWMDYYRETGSHLYDNGIQAWSYGPVVPDAYYEFWTNVSNIIRYTRTPSEEIDLCTDIFLEHTLDRYREVSISSFVDMTHGEDTPWSRHYKMGRKEAIPFRTMIDSMDPGNRTPRIPNPIARG